MNWKDPDIEDDLPPPRQPMTAAGRLLIAVLIVMMAVLIAVLVVRTRSGSEMIADILHQHTGLDLEIGAASLQWPADLVLRQVKARTAESFGGFKAGEIRLGLRWNGVLDVAVTGAELDFVRTADGWLPGEFRRIAVLNDVRETADLFRDLPGRLSLDIRGGAITWSTPDGDAQASVKGLDLWVVPVDVTGRRMWWYELSARRVTRRNGAEGRTLRRLWMSAPESAYVGIAYHAIWSGGSGPVQDWWSVPSAEEESKGESWHEK